MFQDSDLAKWLEAAAYSLMLRPDEQLERTCDDLIALISRAQQPDGYLNTYDTVKEPGKRWTNLRDCHELYCAGHMMEAACAYYEATGKRELLDIMTRMARHIDSVIGPEEGKLHGYPGHEEIELALVRMYHATGDELMMKLARYFIDERGKLPNFFVEEKARREGKDHFNLTSTARHMRRRICRCASRPRPKVMRCARCIWRPAWRTWRARPATRRW